MIRLVVRGLLARKLRTILTSIAIVLGVAMVAGTFILTNQITTAFDEIFQAGNEKIDAVVQRQTLFDSSGAEVPPLPESIVEQVRRTDGVAVADGSVWATASVASNHCRGVPPAPPSSGGTRMWKSSSAIMRWKVSGARPARASAMVASARMMSSSWLEGNRARLGAVLPVAAWSAAWSVVRFMVIGTAPVVAVGRVGAASTRSPSRIDVVSASPNARTTTRSTQTVRRRCSTSWQSTDAAGRLSNMVKRHRCASSDLRR